MESFIVELFKLQAEGLQQRNLTQSCGNTVVPASCYIFKVSFIYLFESETLIVNRNLAINLFIPEPLNLVLHFDGSLF